MTRRYETVDGRFITHRQSLGGWRDAVTGALISDDDVIAHMRARGVGVAVLPDDDDAATNDPEHALALIASKIRAYAGAA